MNDTAKPTDAELLRQLEGAVARRECSPNYACTRSYELGRAQGRLEQAIVAVETVKGEK